MSDANVLDYGRVAAILESKAWKFAKTMPHNPHHYTLRSTWDDQQEFVDVVLFIRKHGVQEKFKGRYYTVLYANGFKYWTMGCPVGVDLLDPVRHTILINRKAADVE